MQSIVDVESVALATITHTHAYICQDLFISDEFTRPNKTNSRWTARNYRDDSITIPSSELKKQDYYIGVNAFLNVTFSITASFKLTTRLQDGKPQAGKVRSEASNYYTMVVDENTKHVTFTLSPYNGRAYLFVSTTEKPDRTKPSTYQRSSFEDSLQSITFAAGDTDFCTKCTYYVMVTGAANETSYSILGATSNSITSLQDGIPLYSQVSTKEWQYYTFKLDNEKADLQISLTPLSGDPDLYISTEIEHPTETNYTLKSTGTGSVLLARAASVRASVRASGIVSTHARLHSHVCVRVCVQITGRRSCTWTTPLHITFSAPTTSVSLPTRTPRTLS